MAMIMTCNFCYVYKQSKSTILPDIDKQLQQYNDNGNNKLITNKFNKHCWTITNSNDLQFIKNFFQVGKHISGKTTTQEENIPVQSLPLPHLTFCSQKPYKKSGKSFNKSFFLYILKKINKYFVQSFLT